ncbi:hypothetical protein RI054_37g141190 [Pseudoscourfieldia marina]
MHMYAHVYAEEIILSTYHREHARIAKHTITNSQAGTCIHHNIHAHGGFSQDFLRQRGCGALPAAQLRTSARHILRAMVLP